MPPLLILDLDETLIRAVDMPYPHTADFAFGPFFVYVRPHLREFLTGCANHYDIAVWSAGGSDYVNGIVDKVFPGEVKPVFIWSREKCTPRADLESGQMYYKKDLQKVVRRGYELSQILIVEDTQENVEDHPGNAVYISPFFGAPDDAELRSLGRYLVDLSGAPDMRAVEKQFWRD